MKSKLIPILMVIIAFTISLSSCKKAQHNPILPSVQVTVLDNGKTIQLAHGQTLSIKLGNPGDGGYTFNVPQYNASILTLKGHTHTASTTNAVGDYGTDTWEFSTQKSGSAVLTITATRSPENNNAVVLFTGTIAVN